MRSESRPLAVAVLGRGLVDPDVPVIHADDAGLLRGLAAFETLRVYAGRPFAMTEHLDRLALSASRLRLALPPLAELRALADVALAAASTPECSLRFTVTGGRPGSGPVAMVMILALPEHLEEVRARGISVIALQLGTDPQVRRDAPWLLDGVKSTSYAVNVAAWDEARRRGAEDAVFLATDGSVLEGPVTNVWWRHGSTLHTPALELGILAGVTRAYVIRIASALSFEVQDGAYPLSHLTTAEEAFSSSSIRELMPIVKVDASPVGAAVPGEATLSLQAALREAAGA